jgi:hypothetical protein
MFCITVTSIYPLILQIALILSHKRDENEYVKQKKNSISMLHIFFTLIIHLVLAFCKKFGDMKTVKIIALI